VARTFSFYLAAPGDGTSLLEVLDVKDVAEFLMLAIDRSLFGAFNLAARPMSFRDFLSGCKSATHSDAEFVWIPESFLREQGLVPDKVQNWLLPLPYYTQIRQRMVFPKSAAKKVLARAQKLEPVSLVHPNGADHQRGRIRPDRCWLDPVANEHRSRGNRLR